MEVVTENFFNMHRAPLKVEVIHWIIYQATIFMIREHFLSHFRSGQDLSF